MERIDITGHGGARYGEVLTPAALEFVAELDGEFAGRRADLLRRRQQTRQRISAGDSLGFLPETAAIRSDPSWRVAPVAPGLTDRRVEITGPADRKMTINALNSGARVWMADFEDSSSPTWANVVGGQLSLMDALDRRIDFTSPEGKEYRLGAELPTIMVRPRGWHLPEHHLHVGGRPAAGAIVDFGLYFFHCARRQAGRQSGPYFYLPKLENHDEARLWNDIFCRAQHLLGIPRGTIRATVLIETVTAAFEMEEILYELREHSAGLNAGRWDYIFSVIKNFALRGGEYVLPDRAEVTMTVPFMRAYTQALVSTCHRRGAHAIGGMAAFVPNRRDPEVTEAALAAVRADKQREAGDGFDGSWVAHPDLVATCREVFDAALGGAPHQLSRSPAGPPVSAEDLLTIGKTPGRVTLAGLRTNVAVSLRYLTAWLGGQGAVAISNLMEDVATVEISRSQVWQWARHQVRADDGSLITPGLVTTISQEEASRLAAESGDDPGKRQDVSDAVSLFASAALAGEFVEFLTLPAYDCLLRREAAEHGLRVWLHGQAPVSPAPAGTGGRACLAADPRPG